LKYSVYVSYIVLEIAIDKSIYTPEVKWETNKLNLRPSGTLT